MQRADETIGHETEPFSIRTDDPAENNLQYGQGNQVCETGGFEFTTTDVL